MAKGDDKRARNQISQQGGMAQTGITEARNEIIPKTQDLYNRAFDTANIGQRDYSDLMSRFMGDYGNMMDKFSKFSETGGISPEDEASIRARAISPTRAVYANAQANIDRQRSLQGGYSPNYTAATAKMSRDLSQGMSDASTNANASIAEMKARNKLSGLQGMGSAFGQGMGGLTGLYGTAPGMAQMFGNQYLGSMNQWLDTANMQNQLGLGTMSAQNQAAQLPGQWEHNMKRIGDIAGMAGGVVAPWMNRGSSPTYVPQKNYNYEGGG